MKLYPTKLALLLVAILSLLAASSNAQGTSFTYQGRLTDNGNPANGVYDLRFAIYDALAAGNVAGGPVTNANVSVSNGLFTVTLDFGAGVFNGSARWLEIGVRPGGSAEAFTALDPRQALLSSPYAIRALEATTLPAGSVNSLMLADGAVTAAKVAPGAVSQLGTPGGADSSAVQVSTNGLVGIGTMTPSAGLHLTAGANFLHPLIEFLAKDDSGNFTNFHGAGGLAVSGNLVVVASAGDDDAFTVLQANGSGLPTIRSSIRQGTGAFTNLNGAYYVALSPGGTLLAVSAVSENAVTLVDLSNPSNPVWRSVRRDGVGGFNDLGGMGRVALSSNLLEVVGATDNAVTLMDVSNPSNPALRAVLKDGFFGFNDLNGAEYVAFSGTLLVIGTGNDDAITLVDVSNPSNPVLLAVLKEEVEGYWFLHDVEGMALSGSLLAIAGTSNFLDRVVTLVDVSNPAAPVIMSTISGTSEIGAIQSLGEMTLSSNRLAIGAQNGVLVFDVTDATVPRLLSRVVLETAGLNAPGRMAFVGEQLWTTHYSPGTLAGIRFISREVAMAAMGRVGVGTTAPLAPLHVVGDVLVDNAQSIGLHGDHIAIGRYATAAGSQALALGFYASATGQSAVAIGYSAKAGGSAAIAMGTVTSATTNSATAMGYFTVASGRYSTAMGQSTTASGETSTAMGQSTTASGRSSLAVGSSSEATGDYSIAAGRRARALHDGTFVWADEGAPISGTALASTSSNQFLIRASGGVGIGTNSPKAALHVHGTVLATNFAGSGAGLANLNAANLTTGTVSDARLPANIARLDEAQTFSNTNVFSERVGIGTSIPGYPLSVSDVSHQIAVVDSDNANKTWTLTSIQNISGIGLFENGSVGRFVIGAGGAVGIGEPSPTAQLHVRATSSQSYPQLHLVDNGANGFARARFSAGTKPYWDIAAGGANNVINFFTSGGNGDVMTLDTNGNLFIDGALNPPSDRNVKQDFAAVDARAVLEKVTALPIQSWAYKNSPDTRHIGPVAQDFHAAFQFNGDDDKHITTVDADGVALAAIQGLNWKLEAELKRRDAEIAELKQQLGKLERLFTGTTGGGK